MRKMILKRITVIIICCMLAILLLNLFFQTEAAKSNMRKNSQIKLNQIEQIVTQNQIDTERVRKNVEQDYIIRAKMAAYVVQHRPEIEHDLEELRRIAELMRVDELHLFSTEGVIYFGSEPKYYGYSVEDGEQIGFFKPMLTDRSLELCQDVTPNTAESKLMQYAAVWREDGKGIVQIGMNPERLLQAMEKNDLSHIFSMVTAEPGTVIYAVDRHSGEVLGCTDASQRALFAEAVGIPMPSQEEVQSVFSLSSGGTQFYCVTKAVDDMYIAITQEYSYMYQGVLRSMSLLTGYLILISVVMIIAILRQINRVIINSIDGLNRKLAVITAGDLDTVVDVTNTEEFTQLSNNINQMMTSLLNTTNALSRLFDGADIEMGIYEYRAQMKRVLVTRKTLLMMQADELEIQNLLSDRAAFEQRLDEIRANPVEGYADIYQASDSPERYLRIQSFEKDGSVHGIIVDMTEAILERRKIERERDYDLLTGLLSRRAFYSKVEYLFEHRLQDLKCSAMIAADVDNLKRANDTYGHAFGDQLIYHAAQSFQVCTIPGVLAARLSGDEFAVLLYGADSTEQLQEEIRKMLEQMLSNSLLAPDGSEYPVRMSGGYVMYPKYDRSYQNLMRMADMAMYRVKRSGKAGFLEYDDSIAAEQKL